MAGADFEGDPAWTSGPLKQGHVDEHGVAHAPAYGDTLGPLRPCRRCGVPVRQGFEKARVQNVAYWQPVARTDPQQHPRTWWHPRIGFMPVVVGRDRALDLFELHDCRSATADRVAQQEGVPLFDKPKAPGDGVKPDELVGHPLYIFAKAKKTVTTSVGESEAVSAHICLLDTGQVYDDALLFGKVLVGQFEPGGTYCGFIGKGQAQPGKSAPWVFTDSPEHYEVGTKYDAHYKAQAQAAPPSFVPQQAAPTPAPTQVVSAPAAAPVAPWLA